MLCQAEAHLEGYGYELRRDLNALTAYLPDALDADEGTRSEANQKPIIRAGMQWEMSFVLVLDAKADGSISPEQWLRSLKPLCDLFRAIKFQPLTSEEAILGSLQHECRKEGMA